MAHAISVLTSAQQTADRTVAEADGYSARVMSEARDLYEDARRNAAVLEQEAEDKARAVYEDASSRADAIERETIAKIEQLELTSMSAQKELDAQTAYLRTLRDATRTQMEAFLEGLLDRVAEEYGRAHPMAAAEAANRTAQPEGRRAGRLPARANGVAGKPSGPSLRLAGMQERRRLTSTNGAIALPQAVRRIARHGSVRVTVPMPGRAIVGAGATPADMQRGPERRAPGLSMHRPTRASRRTGVGGRSGKRSYQ